MKKVLKYTIGVVIAGVVIYNSINLLPLDVKLAGGKQVEFDATSYVDGIWIELQAAYSNALEINFLLIELKQNPKQTFEGEAKALGIGNIGYFKVQGEGVVETVNENNVIVLVGDQRVEIEMELVFGNAVRDASGLIKIGDFNNTNDFNNISETINEKIRKEVIPDFKSKVKKGDNIQFQGAIKLNKMHLELDQPEVIPVYLKITQ